MTYSYYRNKRNKHKVIIVKNDGYGHNYVKQIMLVKDMFGEIIINDYIGFYSRWKKNNLDTLLSDYFRVSGTPKGMRNVKV